MRIYIAGALSSKEKTDRNPTQVVVDYIANVHKMLEVACHIRKMGYAPYVPALDFQIGIVNGDWNEQDYRGISDEFLPVCDAVLVISDSWGVQREIKSAHNFNIPVFYSIEELNKWGKPE